MNPRLSMLARQLDRSMMDLPTPGDPQAKMMTSYKETCDREAKATVQLMQDKLDAAQSEIASLKAQLIEAAKEGNRGVKDYSYKLDSLKEAHKQELDKLAQKHYDQNGQVHAQLDAVKKECAKECEDKARAQTELAGANRMIAKLEQTIAKLQNDMKAMPAVQPDKKKPISFTTKVSQRDENGRIVSSITTPNY